jgi:hypothetical protein
MQVVIPYIGELQPIDARMLRLAEFLGIPCETLALEKVSEHAGYLKKAVPDRGSCFVVNPQVMKQWVGANGFTFELVAFLQSRFTHILVHGLRVDACDTQLVHSLSRGKLTSVVGIGGEGLVYKISQDSKRICDAFSGLSFGPVNALNDHALRTCGSDPAVQDLISIGGQPFMAAVRLEGAELLFVASEDVADLNAEVGDAPITDYFSRLVPHVMALRYAAGEECWRPGKAHASIIIDDPLLRNRYGFLNFESLLRLAADCNFHATIAFIPHNFRRSSSKITRMFQAYAKRLSICFHGTDHTEAEFASTDSALLNTLLHVAEDRMAVHHQITGISCDRVMVFPQGNFSIEAMRVLKAHNFYAAVNTIPHPAEKPVRLKIGELAQPAVLRYGGFPLFLRKPIRETQSHDIAFNLFFGRPVLIVEHHDVFQHPELLVEIAARINSAASEINWSNLATVAGNSTLRRTAPDGTHHVRGYSGMVTVSNTSRSTRRYSIEWSGCESDSIEQVLVDAAPISEFELNDGWLRASVDVAAGASRMIALVRRNGHATIRNLGLRRKARAFIRRRLSEVRDNYLSKNEHLLTAARTLQRRFLR